jgi:hypothetical protein
VLETSVSIILEISKTRMGRPATKNNIMIIQKKDFCLYVEDSYLNNNLSLIDTVLEACDYFNIEYDLVKVFINRQLKEKLRIEFEKLNYLKSDNINVI